MRQSHEGSKEDGAATADTDVSLGPESMQGPARRRRLAGFVSDARLKAIFDHVADQPIPDDFLDQLRRISARSPA